MWLLLLTAARLRRDRILPFIMPDTGGLMTSSFLPSELHGAPAVACPAPLLHARERDWVQSCFSMDNADPLLISKLEPWVRYRHSVVTGPGRTQLCQAGLPCRDSVLAYRAAFDEAGCKNNRAHLETFKLAKSLEQAVMGCQRFGDAAATQPAEANGAVAPLGPHSCYHDFPGCGAGGGCLDFPPEHKVLGAQRFNELYLVQGECYIARDDCVGCLFHPSANKDSLEPWICPNDKCSDAQKFAVADAPLPDDAACVAQCDGEVPCGHDGCGGSCGVCDEGQQCNRGSCVYRPFKLRFTPKARVGKDAPPEWFERLEGEQAVSRREEARDEALQRQAFPDFQFADGRQGKGQGLTEGPVPRLA